MSIAARQIVIIFVALLTGYTCRKLHVLDEAGTSSLSNTVVNAILPFYLFHAIASSKTDLALPGLLRVLGLSMGLFLLCGLIAMIIVPALRAPVKDRGVYLFEIMCGNVTYIGIPVCTSVLGSNASFYASLLNIPYNLLCFSLGVFLLCGKMSLKKVMNPAFLAGILGALCFLLQIKLPSVILEAFSFLGKATSPCAMLVVGSVLGSVPLRDVFDEWRAIPYVIIRLLGLPALILLLLQFIEIDPVLKGVLVLMAGMPAATNSTMLCAIYGGNRDLSAKLIFLSTLLSLFTIPIWTNFL